ncbi:MAG TPA: hypothetical protein EYM94_02555, partial [Gammaproteobacteria bacterium]|nr:hypothetical protein [Gammaproteobacteria bacterium]
MKKLLLLLSLLLATNASAHSGDTGEHTHIFNQCETKEKIDTLNQPPVLLKLNAPKYPRRAQQKGIEGRVFVLFWFRERVFSVVKYCISPFIRFEV